MVRFDLRFEPERVTALRKLAGRLSYESESGETVRWTDLVRLGVEWVLDAEGDRKKVAGPNDNKETT